MSKRDGGFVLGAIIGGAAAAITALLFAPKSGRELRKDIADEFDNLMDTAYDYRDIAMEKGNELVEVAKEATDDIKVSLKDTTHNLKSQLSESSSKITDDFKKAKEEVNRSVEDIKVKAADAKDMATVIAEEGKEEVKTVNEGTTPSM
ncbi:YtxH domain-containing protein [Jeotgalibaca caeni]|uniref:YtxH domain-containing protein n=1 Tax=Jeotgalibaca caeni TaxID=3028623 RepID=UPI00237D7E04|nr:YtxH domain-containing protein [Jeotgalibaca caeni]MDE1549705.1 YtxH domain-containing protein [Jeotgalibaca caeni]